MSFRSSRTAGRIGHPERTDSDDTIKQKALKTKPFLALFLFYPGMFRIFIERKKQ
jgi:hypothetical protein